MTDMSDAESTPRRHHRSSVSRRPGWIRRRALHIGTFGLGMIAAALGAAYRYPELTRPVPRPGARVYSLVQQIDAAGPVWLILFVSVGLILMIAACTRRQVADVAHGLAAGAHGMFSSAVWIGWALSDPRPPAVAGLLSLALVIIHPVMAIAHSNRWRE